MRLAALRISAALRRLLSLLVPRRPHGKATCDYCGTFVGTTGGRWTGYALVCESEDCTFRDLERRTM